MVDRSLYTYHLPEELIAKQPVIPRDFSRLLVYDTKSNKIAFDHFYHLDKYLPPKSFLVMNDTKVLPARVEMKKVPLRPKIPGLRWGQGGKVKVLFLVNEVIGDQLTVNRKKENMIRAFVDRKVYVGDKLFFDRQYFVTVINQQQHSFTLQFDFSVEKLFSILEKKGVMPIPLYIKNSPLKRGQLLQKYQTIFAQKKGSAAAPTASLHFTNRLFGQLDRRGFQRLFVTLHVGLGTFAPVTDENIRHKRLHEEYFEVENGTLQLINKLKQEGDKLVAVGTTVTRTLETIKNLEFRVQNSELIKEKILNSKFNSEFSIIDSKFIGRTDLFIYPPYRFQMVNHLITNFHLPGSSLMMLVEAFLQHRAAKRHLVDLYKIAIKEKLRFYSFGDAMIII